MPGEPLPLDPIAEARRQWIEHDWEPAALGMAAVTSVIRAHQLLLARIDAVLRPLELSFARYELLMLLTFAREGALPMSNATARLQVHPTSVTNTVDRLERDRLVDRTPNPRDARSTVVVLTAKGRAVAADATALLNREVFERPGFADAELVTLTGILARFRRDAGDFTDPTPTPEPLG